MSDLISRQEVLRLIRMAMPEEAGSSALLYQSVSHMYSAQPEIIRCKDCKWKQGSECVRFAGVRPFPGDYCSRAERRTNVCLNQQKSGD